MSKLKISLILVVFYIYLGLLLARQNNHLNLMINFNFHKPHHMTVSNASHKYQWIQIDTNHFVMAIEDDWSSQSLCKVIVDAV